MSRTIDERVVQMSFDNSKFESNVGTSLKTIDNLKKSLNFEGAGNGLEKSIRKLDFGAISSGLEAVTNKFSVLGTIGDQVIRNITNKVMNLGEALVSSITVDPLKDGLHEYETQMESVQTILANTQSKGTTINDVNEALDELNTYADKTIYNFTQMTKNIGTFTAAGLDLETSTQSIKGIANLAAVSGSTSQQASTAMYQLSQALATGTVKLQDWNSVVNAGMGGEVFQEALKRTSRVLGTGVDQAIEKYGTFRESLTQGGWLTTEVLSETLKQLAGSYSEADLLAKGYSKEQTEQILQLAKTAEESATMVKTFTQLLDTLKEALGSGWTQSFEYIFGDFEKARAMWTSVSDVLGSIIGKISDQRNNMLKEWSDFGGRQSLLLGFKYAFEDLLSVILPIKDAFQTIFPPTTAQTLLKITSSFRELMKSMILTREQTYNLRGIAQGVFGAIKIAIDLVVKAATSAKEAFSSFMAKSGLSSMISNVMDFAGKLGYLISDIARFGSEANSVSYKFAQLKDEFPLLGNAIDIVVTAFTVLKTTAESVWSIIKVVADVIFSFGKAAAGGFSSAFSFLHERIDVSGLTSLSDILAKIRETATGIGDNIKGATSKFESFGSTVGGIFGRVAEVIKSAADAIWNFVSPIFDKIKTAFQNAFGETDAVSLSTSAMGLGGTLASFAVFLDAVKGPSDSITNLIDSLKDTFAGEDSVFGKIGTSFDQIKAAFSSFGDVLESWQKKIEIDYIRSIAVSIAILAASLIALSMVQPEGIALSLAAIMGLFEMLKNALEDLGELELDEDAMEPVKKTMLSLSVAIFVLAQSVKTMAELDPASLAGGLAGVIVLVKALTTAMDDMSDVELPEKGMGGLIMFALAIRVLASAVNALSGLNFEELITGLGGVGALIAGMAVFLNQTKDTSMGVGTGVALLTMAIAIKVLASSVKEFGAMDPMQLIQGLFGVGSVLLMFGGLANMLRGATAGLVGAGVAMIAMGAGLLIITNVIASLGAMDFNQLVQGMLSFAGVMLVMTAALAGLGMIGPVVMVGGAALLTASVGILALAGALALMSNIGDVGKVLLVLGVSLLELAVGLTAMIGAIPGAAALLIAAGALALLAPTLMLLGSMSLDKVGTALLAIVGAFTVLGGAALILTPLLPVLLGLAVALGLFSAAVAVAGVGLLAVGTGLAAIATAFTMLAAMAGTQCDIIVQSIRTIAFGVLDLIPEVLGAIGEGIVQILQIITENGPAIADALMTVVPLIIDALGAVLPQILVLIGNTLTGILNLLTEKVPEIGNAALQIILGVLNVINTNLPLIIQAGVDVVIGFITGVESAISQVVEAAFDLVINFMNGIGDTFRERGPELGDAARNMFEGIIEGIVGAIIPGGEDIVAEFAGILDDVIAKIVGYVGDFVQAGKDLVDGMFEGISKFGDSVATAAKNVADGALKAVTGSWDEHSRSKETLQYGAYFDEGAHDGITENADSVKNAAKDMAEGALGSVDDTFSNTPGLMKNVMGQVTDSIKNGGADALKAQKDTEEKSKAQTRANIQAQVKTWKEGSKQVEEIGDDTGKIVKEDSKYIYKEVHETFNGIESTYIKKVPKIKEQQDKAVENTEKAAKKSTGTKKEFVKSDSQFWKDLYVQHQAGAANIKESDDGLAKFEEETLKKTQDIIKDYTENLDTNARKMTNQGLFSKVSEKSQVTKEELAKNLQDQINQINEYTDVMNSLNSRISSTALKDAINEMGVESLGELQALNSMTDEELTNYTNLYDTKYTASVAQLKAKAQNELSNLYGGVPINIDAFAATFDGSLKSIESYFTSPETQAKVSSSGKYITKGVAEGMKDGEALASIDEAATAVEQHTTEESISNAFGINSPAEATKPHGEYITMGIAEGMVDDTALAAIQKSADILLDEIVKAFNLINDSKSTDASTLAFAKNLTDTIDTVLKDMTNKASEFKNVSTEYMKQLCDGIKSKQNDIKNVITECVRNMIDTFKSKKDEFKIVGEAYMISISEGMLGKFDSDTVNRIKEIVEKFITNFKQSSDQFKEVGEMYVKGLIEGIKSKSSDLYKTIDNIIKEAIKSAKKSAKIKSPSKETYAIGEYLGLGLINALKDISGAVTKASTTITEDAMSGFRDAVSLLSGIEDFDSTPVIAPVMDLTGIQNGVYEMGRMLDTNRAYNIAANVSAGLSAQRSYKLNEMASLRNAIDSVQISNQTRSGEIASLKAAIGNLNNSITNQSYPDFVALQTAIGNLNNSIAGQSTPDYVALRTSIDNLNAALSGQVPGTTEVNNTFNIQSSDPKGVANEVNKALQKMVNRRSAVWA